MTEVREVLSRKELGGVMTPEQIAELEALAAKATPGPWLRSNDPKKWVSTLAPITSQEWRDNAENDAALIIAIRNNLPAILAALKAQQPDEAMVERNRSHDQD